MARALRRQSGLALAIILCCVLLGFVISSIADAGPELIGVWALFGIAAGLILGFARESLREAVGPLSLARLRGVFRLLGGAPALTKRDLRELPPDMRSPIGCLVYKPASAFSSAARALHQAIAERQVVAFIGAVPDEGATTAALSAAISAAQQAYRVLIIDGDLRRRSLTRVLTGDPADDPAAGVLEAAREPSRWRDLIQEERETGLHFLPAAAPDTPWRSLFSEPGWPDLLSDLRAHYDLIVLDCPPALTSAEGPMLSRLADERVLLAVWDETPLSALRAVQRVFRRQTPPATALFVNQLPSGVRIPVSASAAQS